MRKAVREAVLHRFEACLPGMSRRLDVPAYTREPYDNLLPALAPALLDDFASGDGRELEGDLPKFCAAHSSAALAANAFGCFRFHPERLRLAGLAGFTEARFEHRLSTGLPGNPPNLDFFISGPNGAVAVESKFTEVLAPKVATFAASYSKAVERLADSAWQRLFEALKENPRRFTKLDAAQLVKHYLGMRHSLADHAGRLVLLYMYWEPSNAQSIPEFIAHAEEVAAFSNIVRDSEVQFLAIGYPDLWDEWSRSVSWEGIEPHVGALRARYSMPVPPV